MIIISWLWYHHLYHHYQLQQQPIHTLLTSVIVKTTSSISSLSLKISITHFNRFLPATTNIMSIHLSTATCQWRSLTIYQYTCETHCGTLRTNCLNNTALRQWGTEQKKQEYHTCCESTILSTCQHIAKNRRDDGRWYRWRGEMSHLAWSQLCQ